MNTRREAAEALQKLRHFIGRSQLRCIGEACYGEERQFFYDKVCELAATVEAMPTTGQTDGEAACGCRLMLDDQGSPQLFHCQLHANAGKTLKALKAAVERMEAVSAALPVEKRAEGVSQRGHVQHLAGHLFQHSKIAKAEIAKAEGR